jgi:hypothetical protein
MAIITTKIYKTTIDTDCAFNTNMRLIDTEVDRFNDGEEYNQLARYASNLRKNGYTVMHDVTKLIAINGDIVFDGVITWDDED